MAQHTDTLDLGRIGLHSGEGRSLDLKVRLAPLEFGGQTYTSDADVPVRLDVSRMLGGYSLRLRFAAALSGPCMRCLEDAGHGVDVDAREVDQPGGGSDELLSPYVDGDELDLHAWARDALVLELPTQIVCSEECKGICGICGANLNTAGDDHGHEKAPDARWGKLSELRFE
jgi:uncharacterized protein